MNKSTVVKGMIWVVFLTGVIVGSAITLIVLRTESLDGETPSEKKPLYWVAPMDADYRRDGPGKSPMGMDLVPVYDEGDVHDESGPGTIKISPDVVNNLGVRTALVEKKALRSDILTVGYIKYDEGKLIHIHPRVSGWVEKLYVTATGDPVTKGSPLYALYSPELVNAQEELVLALNRNNTRLVQAASDRLSALHIPQAFINQLQRSKNIQQTVTFYAPQDGVVDKLNIREGFFVQPGTTMLSIGALDHVWVEAEVFERQASLVKEGASVTMSLGYLPGKTWSGTVDYIYPALDSKTRTARVRLRFANPENQLKPNMFAQVIIHSNGDEPVLVIPREALIRTATQHRVVLALGNGRFKSLAVRVGQEDQHHIEIRDGLVEGDRIVSSAQFLLDSESSKTSDFKRMHHDDKASNAVWVAGVIENQMRDERLVVVSHDAIADWSMPAMTMNFAVNNDVNFDALTPGTELHMEITKGDRGMFEIIGTHIMDHSKTSSPKTHQSERSAASEKGEKGE